MTEARKPDKPRTVVGIMKWKDKTKNSEGSGMESDQAEQLDVLLS